MSRSRSRVCIILLTNAGLLQSGPLADLSSYQAQHDPRVAEHQQITGGSDHPSGASSAASVVQSISGWNFGCIFGGAVAFSPCLECSIAINLVAAQPFDLGQPAQEDEFTFALETQNSTHDTLAPADDPRSTPLRPPPSRLAGGAARDLGQTAPQRPSRLPVRRVPRQYQGAWRAGAGPRRAMSAAWRRWPSSDVSFSVEWTWAIDREARRELEGAARIATERPFPRGCVGDGSNRPASPRLRPQAAMPSARQRRRFTRPSSVHIGSGCQRHPPLPQSSSASRFTAGPPGS